MVKGVGQQMLKTKNARSPSPSDSLMKPGDSSTAHLLYCRMAPVVTAYICGSIQARSPRVEIEFLFKGGQQLQKKKKTNARSPYESDPSLKRLEHPSMPQEDSMTPCFHFFGIYPTWFIWQLNPNPLHYDLWIHCCCCLRQSRPLHERKRATR